MSRATLILTYALASNVGLYINEPGPPYRQGGARLEIHKPLKWGAYFDLIPYVWNAKEDRLGNGGAIARLGWMGDHFGLSLEYEHQSNCDRETLNRHIIWNAVELRWRLN